ncbi:MAG: hypothetical protein EHM42_06670 [Planctomycetaceae bacterium]|nr:MAG: hypothetical protein EHM42_06670 [Planctomycetaceae bacterium]
MMKFCYQPALVACPETGEAEIIFRPVIPITILLTDDIESIEWNMRVQFFKTENPADNQVILGHAGFLDYFSANFDGLNAILTLFSNESLPKTTAAEVK